MISEQRAGKDVETRRRDFWSTNAQMSLPSHLDLGLSDFEAVMLTTGRRLPLLLLLPPSTPASCNSSSNSSQSSNLQC